MIFKTYYRYVSWYGTGSKNPSILNCPTVLVLRERVQHGIIIFCNTVVSSLDDSIVFFYEYIYKVKV